MRMTVAKKLWLCFGLLVLVLALSGILSYGQIRHILKDVIQVVEVVEPLEEAILEMEINAGETARAVLDYTRHVHPADMEKAHDSEADFERFAAKFDELAKTDEQRRLGNKVAQLYGEFKILGDEIMALADQRRATRELFRKDAKEIEKLAHQKLRTAIDSTAPNAMKKLKATFDMEINIDEAFIAIQAYIFRPDPTLKQEILDAEAHFKRSETMYQETSLSADEKTWLSQIDKDFAEAMKAGNEITATTDKMHEKLGQFDKDLEKIDMILDDQVQPLIHAEMFRAAEDARTSTATAATLMLVVVVLGTFIASASAWAISRGIIKPVDELAKGTEIIGRGMLDHKIEIKTKDEFGQLAVAFNRMTENLKRSGEELRASEENLAITLHSIGDAVMATDSEGQVVRMNPVAENLTGWKFSDAKARPLNDIFNIVNEETRNTVESPVDRVLHEGVVVGLGNHTLLISKDGTEWAIDDSGAPIRNAQDDITGVVLVFRDVTEKRRAESRITHLNEVLRAIRNVNQLITREKNREPLIQGVCENFVQTKGYLNAWIVLTDESHRALTSVEAGLGDKFSLISERIEGGDLPDCCKKALTQPGVVVIEDPFSSCVDCPLSHMYRDRGGIAIRLEHGGKMYGILVVSVPGDFVTDEEESTLFEEVAGDVAFGLHSIELEEDRKRAEEALQLSAHDLRERVKELNCLYGISKLVGKPDTSLEEIVQGTVDLIPPSWQYPEITCARATMEGREFITENSQETIWKQTKDITVQGETIGSIEVCYLQERPESDEGPFLKEERSLINAIAERLGYVIEGKRGEDEKKELEARLFQAQKLEAIGTLAGGIAHDFNNLLMAIQSNASLVLFDIDSTHPHYEFLTNIEDLVKSGAELTKQLLGYARKGRYYVQPMNINELVEKTSDTIGRTRRDISVHRELPEDLFAIEADKGQIQQVLLNLLVNAADAMPVGGDLMLKTTNITDKDMQDKLYDPKPGSYVLLTVTDTGGGMDEETTERIFEPFFTTKEMASGRGTGLGLASVYGIIKGHGGYIDVESELGRGTTFAIYLPATEKKVEKTVTTAEQIIKGTETVLLVDDEDRVIDVGTKVLERLGYTVLEARGGWEAV